MTRRLNQPGAPNPVLLISSPTIMLVPSHDFILNGDAQKIGALKNLVEIEDTIREGNSKHAWS